MLAKIAGIIGLAAGAYLGYRHGPHLLVTTGLVLTDTDFWSQEATRTLKYVVIIVPTVVVGGLAYFIVHLFRRFD
ncbi:hypothetical protein FJY63_02815 [Candidatus Sumerlaeota bacterium]|nr:hypothetical protein [Candidatus Sumerlaeota bacterium]